MHDAVLVSISLRYWPYHVHGSYELACVAFVISGVVLRMRERHAGVK
jgi:hypothetical protein